MNFAASDPTGTPTTPWKAGQKPSGLPVEQLAHQPLHSLLVDLAEEHAILADLASNLRCGFLLLNTNERIAYANATAQQLLHLDHEQSAADVRAQLVSLAAQPRNAQTELDRLWRHPEQDGTTDLALTNAAIRWLRVQSFPIHAQPGRLLGRGLLLDDITLERSAAQTRNETLALAAHGLKTPLAIIKGSATTLLSNSMRWDPAMQREMLQMIDTQADRLHEILHTLLEVWRLDAGAQNLRLSHVLLSALLNPLIERWRKNAPHHRFVCDIATTLPPLLCDSTRIEQALQHLLHNAVTYAPNGGTIHVRVKHDATHVYLSISDQGRGIAPEHLEHIFERFYRVTNDDEHSQGHGLGLAMVRATVEAHGGRIWADSPGLNAGATFYCTLPLIPPNAHSSTTPALAMQTPLVPTTNPHQSAHAHITVVESDPRMARYIRANLEEEHYHVQVLTTGNQFLHQIDLTEPNLVLLATNLPDMPGLELLQRLREFSAVPVIMLCHDDDEDVRVHLFDAGADDLVNKPFSIKELLARLRVHLRRQCPQPAHEPVTIFTSGDLRIDYAQRQVSMQGRPVQLSRTEYKLLSTLAQNAGRVLTHELLLERVWGEEYNREVDFIWVYISRLRRKIEPDSRHPRYIVTVPDVGYKLMQW